MSAPLIQESPIGVNMDVDSMESYEEPLGDRLRNLRSRLCSLAKQMDVFIVVGGSSGTYDEDDILLVDKDALEAANQADTLRRGSAIEKAYQCTVCPMSFQNPNDFRDHMCHHPVHLEHSCWSCGNKYKTIEDLEKHRAEHDDEELICYLCNTHFENVVSLNKHNCGWRCPECRVSSTCRSALSRHMRMSHRDVSPFICDACFRPFLSKESLKEHMLAHQRATFVCGFENCVLRFSSRSLLVDHIQSKHSEQNVTNEEPDKKIGKDSLPTVACEYCDQTFGSFAAMRRHSSIHRKRFNSERVLRSAKKSENNVSAVDTSEDKPEQTASEEISSENKDQDSIGPLANNSQQEEYLEDESLAEDTPIQ